MALGGKRPGAGRKKGFAALAAERTRAKVAEMVEKEIVPMTLAQIEQAKKGNTVAFKELLDRGFGKVKDSVDLTTDGEKLVFVPAELLTKHAIDTPRSPSDDSEGQA
jgi:hypothetical protein